MWKINKIFSLVIIILINYGCSNDNEEVTPLPDNVIIEINDKNLTEGRVSLIATQTNGNQTGQWSIMTDNETIGQFETTSNSLTRFTGSILETYEVRWTITNGEESIYNNKRFLMCHGEPIEEVVQIERNVSKLVYLASINIFTLEELVSAGITFQELLDENLTISELLDHFNITDLYFNEITITQMLDEGLTLEFLWNRFIQDTNFVPVVVGYFLNENIQIADLVNAGAQTGALYFHGASLQQLVDSDLIPLKEIIVETNNTFYDLFPLNIPQQTLIEEGIIVETSINGFYIMNYLFDSAPSSFIDDLNANYPNGNSLWRLPTYDELILFYNESSSLDLKLDLRNEDLWYMSSTVIQCWPPYEGNRFVNLDNGDFADSCENIYTVPIPNESLMPVIQL